MPRATKEQERVQLQFRLTNGQRTRLRTEAKRRAVSVNYLIENMLEDALVKLEREKAPKPRV